MDIQEKLEILSASAKYDASCSSSGSNRKNTKGGIGNGDISGICHSWGADGRCISLLKILLTNCCIYDCKYCINRCSNNIKRATFTPREIADLAIGFYKRNYIEGLFLSSAVLKSPDYTMELIYESIYILRKEYKFNGYIHSKIIPGSSQELIDKLGTLVDRMSINIELPSNNSLKLLAPDKSKVDILTPMKYVSNNINFSKQNLLDSGNNKLLLSGKGNGFLRTKKEKFAPAGQTTQLIVGASPESDLKIIKLSENLYQKLKLKRVYYSAYISLNKDKNLPTLDKPPLLRENRLYQADWLLRFYGFKADELLNEENPNFNTMLDPKCDWALRHLDNFPVEINEANYYTLLRVPGIGVISAKRIVTARRAFRLNFDDLKKLGIVLKRARYFITCNGKYYDKISNFNNSFIETNLLYLEKRNLPIPKYTQTSIFDSPTKGDVVKCLTGNI
ncbi:MAG: putative DNA modification/repair radical SAM protein [Clostridia bacterium]|nr:putative DNA modification/repair radical SAM protein [Clostridia bacterium]